MIAMPHMPLDESLVLSRARAHLGQMDLTLIILFLASNLPSTAADARVPTGGHVRFPYEVMKSLARTIHEARMRDAGDARGYKACAA